MAQFLTNVAKSNQRIIRLTHLMGPVKLLCMISRREKRPSDMVFRYSTDCGSSSQLLKTENVQIDAERETLLRLRVNNFIIFAEN